MARIDWKEALRPSLILATIFTGVDMLSTLPTRPRVPWLLRVLEGALFFAICYVIGTTYGALRSFVVPRMPRPPRRALRPQLKRDPLGGTSTIGCGRKTE